MIRRHLTPALVAFSAMLVCCLAAPSARDRWWVAGAAAVLLAAAAVTLISTPVSTALRRVGLLALGAAAGFALGLLSQSRMWTSFEGSYLPAREPEVAAVTGVVTRDSTLTRQGDTAVPMDLDSAYSAHRGVASEARGGLLLLVDGDARFAIGQRLSARAAVAQVPDLGPQRWVARARRADVRSAGFSSPLWRARALARDWLHRTVSGVGYPASALLEALLVGVRQDVPPDLYDSFYRTGSLHILALSGLHVTVIYGVAGLLLWFVRRRWLKFLIATAALLFYQVLAGFMPSLLRATVMIVIGGVASLLDRDRETLNVLALSGIVLLLIDPFQAFTVSFQLSFLALAGILVLGALVQRPLASRLPRFLLGAFAMSVGAQAATLPLVIGTFGAWYPSGLLANLVLVPLTTGFLWAGLAWLPLSLVPWPALHAAAATGFGAFYRAIHLCADVFAVIPGLTFPASSLPWLAVLCALAAVLAATVLPWKRRPSAARPVPR